MSIQVIFTELTLIFQENIYDDFTCALQKAAVIQQGRMYITESYICFSSSMLGMEQKVTKYIILLL
jgi:hypothetical protein